MEKKLFRKAMVLATIGLFIGAGFIPIITGINNCLLELDLYRLLLE